MGPSASILALGALMACGGDHVIAYPAGGGGGDDGSTDDTGGGGGDGGTGGDAGTAQVDPIAAGALVVTELMIDANAVEDEHGEWVELLNASEASIALDGLVLGDDNVDAWVLDGGLQVAAGALVVLCADAETATNGGAPCDGTFHYNTWGEGFALANEGDEVRLVGADGTEIDRMSYGKGQVLPGTALGLDPGQQDASANDASSAWCGQQSSYGGGDAGTPGQPNDGC